MCSTFFHVFVSHHNFRSRSQWALVSSWTSSSSSRSSKSSRIWSSKELNSDAKRPWHDKVQFQSSDVSRLWRNRFQAVKILRISLASSCIQFIREDPAFRPCITLAKSYGISDMKDVACCTALCLGCLSKFVISEAALNLPSSSFIFYNVLHMCSQGHRMHAGITSASAAFMYFNPDQEPIEPRSWLKPEAFDTFSLFSTFFQPLDVLSCRCFILLWSAAS